MIVLIVELFYNLDK